MPSAVILTTVAVDVHKLEEALSRSGQSMVWDARGCLLSRGGTTIAVHDSSATLHDLPDRVAAGARALLGRRPKVRLTCQYDAAPAPGPAAGGTAAGGTAAGGTAAGGAPAGGEGDGWRMVLDVARAVAGRVPLAVLVDPAGTVRLVHPERGLVSDQEYQAHKRPNPVADLLRRFLGEGR